METPTLDHTKLNIDLSAYGVNGNELENLLMEQGIFLELVTGNIIMCMSGIGNTRSDFERLLTALREITAARKPVTAAKMAQPPRESRSFCTLSVYAVHRMPKEARGVISR